MIADFVRGRQILAYEEPVQQGIRLHRAIDDFTDRHEATRRGCSFFRPVCGAYGMVFMDVVYDHFLANDPRYFSQQSLERFAKDTYLMLEAAEEALPDRFRMVFRYMRSENWLLSYRSMQGIHQAFRGITRRAKYLDNQTDTFAVMERHYTELEKCYESFMPDLYDFVQEKISQPD